jgi:hypothetical protein
MTKYQKLLTELNKLRTDDNKQTLDILVEGIGLIEKEYRRRSALEKKAQLESAGYHQLENFRKSSRLCKKAFVESVGKRVIDSDYPQEMKTKMLEALSGYVNFCNQPGMQLSPDEMSALRTVKNIFVNRRTELTSGILTESAGAEKYKHALEAIDAVTAAGEHG